MTPTNKASRGPIFNRLSHVEAGGPRGVHVHLKEPFALWMSFLTRFMGVWPKDSREKLGNDDFRMTPKNVGTGPGVVEEWRPNDYVSFTRNPHYWQKGLPDRNRLVAKIVPEDATRVADLLGGEADIIRAPPPRDFDTLKTHRGIHSEALLRCGGRAMILQNCCKPPSTTLNSATQHSKRCR